jgi:Protein of unknown function (DUF4199)
MAILDDSNHRIDPATVSVMPTGNKWGLILGAAGVILSLLFFLLGIIDYTGTKSKLLPNLIQWSVTGAIFYLAIKAHRDEDLGGWISLGQCIKLGAYMGLIAGIMTAIYMFVHIKFIQPDFLNLITEAAENQAEANGQDPEQVKKGMEMVRWMFTPSTMAVIAFIGSVITSVVISLIEGLFMKKEFRRTF